MASLYIGVYRAVYDYDASTPEELLIAADDLLYLLQKSDVDDWWTVKKRVVSADGADVEEPVGLIPANYIEPAPVVSTCRLLYDYDKQTDEELSFKEGDRFDIYDTSDPDWLLAGDGAAFGFIPANYISFEQSQPVGPLGNPLPRAVTDFAPPPIHKDRLAQAPKEEPAPQPEPVAQPTQEIQDVDGHSDDELAPATPARPTAEAYPVADAYNDDEDDDAPPPMPSRPIETPVRAAQQSPSKPEPTEDVEEHGFDGEYFRWYIDEVDGRKKRPIVLSIGNGLIIMKPKTTNPKKLKLKSASSLDNNWRIRDLLNYNHEKKHVFLELRNPDASIELHAGSKDVAEAIVAVLGDLKGAEASTGLREVARAALTKTSSSNKRVGRLLFDFKAQGADELLCKEEDEVYIVDLSKSKEWWLCERTLDGRQGVIPSSYLEIIATSNLDKLTGGVERRKSQKQNTSSSKGKVVSAKQFRNRSDRDKVRENDKKKRDKAQGPEDDSMPNYHRVRTWIDSSGTFKVEAEFLGCMEGKIHLHKTNGVKIAVAAVKLSIEDLEYVEKVTGTSLQKYKDEVARQVTKREEAKAASGAKQLSSGARSSLPVKPNRTATAAINDIPPPQPDRAKATSKMATSEPDYDWFDFFLTCGVDLGNCQRYSINFSKEQMDESILEDITPTLLRSLGLREGDILRVMKLLDAKFDRKKSVLDSAPTGSLFTEPTGALKNNSTTELSKVNASALPTPSPLKEKLEFIDNQTADRNKIEDDAWAVKPAARSNEDLSAVRPQYTGTLKDLVDVKPLETNKPLPPIGATATTTMTATPSAPAMTPVKTGTLIQPDQQFVVQKTGSSSAMGANRTGGLVPVTTGGLVPVTTGGLIPVQPTGFVPIPLQPTGFVAIQATGGLVSQPTFGIVPLQTGVTTFIPQKTGPQQSASMPPTTFGQMTMQPTASFVPLRPGQVTQPQAMPPTTFGSTPALGSQATGGIANAFVPQSTFGKQITGGFMTANRTGGAQMPPQTSFGGQATGGMIPQTSFGGQATGGMMPQTSFGTQATGGAMPSTSFASQMTGGMMPQTSFGGQATGGMMPQTSFGNQFTGQSLQVFQAPQMGQSQAGMNQLTNMFQNTSIGNQYGQQPVGQPPNVANGASPFGQQSAFSQYGQQPGSVFGQQPSTFSQQPLNFNQQPFGQQPTNMFAQQPTYGQQQTSFGQQPTSFGQQPTSFGQQPMTTFGQLGFEGFGNQPLQSQPTGLGFGNAPNLQAQPTGKRANLQAATADNPFGF